MYMQRITGVEDYGLVPDKAYADVILLQTKELDNGKRGTWEVDFA